MTEEKIKISDLVKKEDPLFGYYFCQPVSAMLVLMIKNLPITPNMLTILSLITGLSGALFYSNLINSDNYHLNLLIGSILVAITLILDCADGQLARVKVMSSQFGAWFDYHSDKVKDITLLLGLTYGAYLYTGQIYVFIFAFLAMAFQFLRNITRLDRVCFDLKNNNPTATRDLKASNQFIRSVKHTLLFKEADRYSLFIIFSILNQISLAIIIYAAIEIFYAASSGYLNYKKYRKFDKQQSHE